MSSVDPLAVLKVISDLEKRASNAERKVAELTAENEELRTAKRDD